MKLRHQKNDFQIQPSTPIHTESRKNSKDAFMAGASRKGSFNLEANKFQEKITSRRMVQTPGEYQSKFSNTVSYGSLIENTKKIYKEASAHQQLILTRKKEAMESIENSFARLNDHVNELKSNLEAEVEEYFDCIFAHHSSRLAKIKSTSSELTDLNLAMEKANSSTLSYIFNQKKNSLISELNQFQENASAVSNERPHFNWAVIQSLDSFCVFSPFGQPDYSPEIHKKEKENFKIDNKALRKPSIISSSKTVSLAGNPAKRTLQPPRKSNCEPKVNIDFKHPSLNTNVSFQDLPDLTQELLNDKLMTNKKNTSTTSLSCMTSPITTPRTPSHYRSFLKINNEKEVDPLVLSRAFDIQEDNKCHVNLSLMKISDSRLIKEILPKLNVSLNIVSINLDNNFLTDKGVKYLLKHVKDMKVTEILLRKNQMTEGSLDYLLSFTKYNNSLKKVCLSKSTSNDHKNKVEMKLKALKEKGILVIFD